MHTLQSNMDRLFREIDSLKKDNVKPGKLVLKFQVNMGHTLNAVVDCECRSNAKLCLVEFDVMVLSVLILLINSCIMYFAGCPYIYGTM